MKTVTSPVTKKKKKKSTKTPEEYFVGIDLHKKFMQVAIMQSDGTVLQNEKIECDYKIVEKKFAKFPDGAKYVIESSSVWYGMYKFLKEKLNLDVILSNPRSTKVIAASKKKTDKVDALILADLLRGGYIVASHVPGDDIIKVKHLVRCRSAIVQSRTRYKNLIHGILLQEGIKIKAAPFSNAFVSRLHGLDDWRIEMYLRTIFNLDEDIADCNTRMKKEVDRYHMADLLKTCPGIGNVTALALASAIDDISRFPNPDKLAAYFGIVPSVRNSAETIKHGRITKEGNSTVRHLLSEAALTHVTWAKRSNKVTPISTFYERLVQKRGGSKAKVAAAAKMVRIVFWMLKKDIGFWACVEEGRKSMDQNGKTKTTKKKRVKIMVKELCVVYMGTDAREINCIETLMNG